MHLQVLFAVLISVGAGLPAFASSADWRLTGEMSAMSDGDRSLIGRSVCGEGKFEVAGKGVRCRICPKFTADSGSDEGFEIGQIVRGRFTAVGAVGEWLLDTKGCETHFKNVGGTILLAADERKHLLGTPAMVAGFMLSAKRAAGPMTVVFYKPGYRLDDCLAFGGDDARTLLVCNETDTAQGEVIGYISAMEISRRGITRWRLLHWYDNMGTDMAEIVSVVPTGMRRVELDEGQPALQIMVKIVETTREAQEEGQTPPGKSVKLMFRRKGQRFFATAKTQQYLEQFGVLTRKMLE